MQSTTHTAIIATLSLIASALPATAQRYVVTPAGFEHIAGNYNNTYPFSTAAGRYHQIHDAADLQTLGAAFVFNSLNFRINGTRGVVARQWEVELNMAATAVTSASMSATFAANFTGSPTTVLPFTTINGVAGTGVTATGPNPIQWTFPFKTIFPYLPAQGNLVWEWRHRNSPPGSWTFMDAATNATVAPTPAVGVSTGTGCRATGRSNPAVSRFTIGASNADLALIDGATNANALLWVGFSKFTAAIPGWCTAFYVQPVVTVGGTTDASGTWIAGSVPVSLLNTTQYFEAHAQFGFLDAGLPSGVGLSDLGTVTGPTHAGRYIARNWALGAAGAENSVSGSVRVNQGLIAIFGSL
jgi:hypothetical protein